MSKENHKIKGLMPWDKELADMKYKDLQIACIVRGMLFEDLVEGDYGKLASFFVRHYTDKIDRSRLAAYEQWKDEQLEKLGYTEDDPLRQYRLTMQEEDGSTKISQKALKKAHIPKEKKSKKERDSTFNIFKGTKKALTFELAIKGESIDTTIKKVIEQFPEAADKSIRIWYKRAIKENKLKKK